MHLVFIPHWFCNSFSHFEIYSFVSAIRFSIILDSFLHHAIRFSILQFDAWIWVFSISRLDLPYKPCNSQPTRTTREPRSWGEEDSITTASSRSGAKKKRRTQSKAPVPVAPRRQDWNPVNSSTSLLQLLIHLSCVQTSLIWRIQREPDPTPPWFFDWILRTRANRA